MPCSYKRRLVCNSCEKVKLREEAAKRNEGKLSFSLNLTLGVKKERRVSLQVENNMRRRRAILLKKWNFYFRFNTLGFFIIRSFVRNCFFTSKASDTSSCEPKFTAYSFFNRKPRNQVSACLCLSIFALLLYVLPAQR